jgi:CspA family cold shock protein
VHPKNPQSAATAGTVKWYEPDLGYGYINPNDGSREVFVHFTALDSSGLSSLSKGQTIHFDKRADGGLTRAANLLVSEAH